MDTLKSIAIKIADYFLDIVFPKYCLGCGKENFYLCPACFSVISTQKSINCFICGRRSPAGYTCEKCRRKNHFSLNGLLVASDWNNPLLRQIIYEYKYRFIKELADPLSQIMVNFLEINQPVNWRTDQLIFIPVPLHPRRILWRGFNQAEILAKEIGRHFNLPSIADILIRQRHTLPQMDIHDQKARRENIRSAFSLSKKYNPGNLKFIQNKIVVLVDDICTTGSTLEECAKTLKPLKPKEIWGLVIARG